MKEQREGPCVVAFFLIVKSLRRLVYSFKHPDIVMQPPVLAPGGLRCVSPVTAGDIDTLGHISRYLDISRYLRAVSCAYQGSEPLLGGHQSWLSWV